MILNKIPRYISVYLFWLIVLALGIWFALISQTALLGLAAKYYVEDHYMRQTLIRFLDKFYILIIGLAWLVLMIVAEELFRRGAAQGRLFQRFAIISGIELLLIFCFDLTILFLQNWMLDPIRLAILAIELILGVGLILVWRNRTTTLKT